jgi:hypothetical protein
MDFIMAMAANAEMAWNSPLILLVGLIAAGFLAELD